MTLDELLKPVKWADEQVLRQYTKVGKRFKLDEGIRRYWVAFGLNFIGVVATGPSAKALGGPIFDWGSGGLTALFDNTYNFAGIVDQSYSEQTSDLKVVNPVHHFLQKYNSIIRFPIFLAGLGFVGKFGIDLYNHFMHGEPLESTSNDCLEYGMGLLSLASSMYIKEIDPKLLKKNPTWKTAYNWVKEKLITQPEPQPVPVPTRYSSLDCFV